jgi:hypothetical protein
MNQAEIRELRADLGPSERRNSQKEEVWRQT